VLAVHHDQPSPATTQLATGLAKSDGGVVQTLLVQQTGDGFDSRQAVNTLTSIATKEGFDGDVRLAVDRATAHAVVHGSTDLGASSVVVETDGTDDDSPLAVGAWEEAIAATLSVPLVLVSHGGERIKRIVLGPSDVDAVDPEAIAFVGRLAQTVGRGEVLELDQTDADWIAQLRAGDLAFVAVATFELMMGLPTPPAGAALAAVPAATLPTARVLAD
jgi:hypothetical protein